MINCSTVSGIIATRFANLHNEIYHTELSLSNEHALSNAWHRGKLFLSKNLTMFYHKLKKVESVVPHYSFWRGNFNHTDGSTFVQRWFSVVNKIFIVIGLHGNVCCPNNTMAMYVALTTQDGYTGRVTFMSNLTCCLVKIFVHMTHWCHG